MNQYPENAAYGSQMETATCSGGQGSPGEQPRMAPPTGMSAASHAMPGSQPMPPNMPGHSPYAQPGPGYAGPFEPAMGPSQPRASAAHADHAGFYNHSDHGPGHPKHDAHQYGQFMGLVNDLANGKTNPAQMMSFLGGLDGQFLKGALVGIGATLILTNDPVKKAVLGALSGLFGNPGKESADTDKS
jgi:hypothetical protein